MSFQNKTSYWIGVVSKDHALKGIKGNFIQLCHGKKSPLSRMKKGDWIIIYSPKIAMGSKELYQKFSGIGQVVNDQIYQVDMNGFKPFRKDVQFLKAKEAPIKPLVDKLSFIKDKKKWGFKFRFGHFKIDKSDFEIIAGQMVSTL